MIREHGGGLASYGLRAVLFLAGDGASYITGETVTVDAGWVAV